MDIDIRTLIGETSLYDKKEKVEKSKPKSWLKSVASFANGEGGVLVFGISCYHAPEFSSNASEFHVKLWNLNYKSPSSEFAKEFLKEEKEFLKEGLKFRKEFLKAQRIIYKLILEKSEITIKEMSEHIGISDRQVRKYVKRLTELNMITREGGRKNGEWKIIDEEYEGFFDRI